MVPTPPKEEDSRKKNGLGAFSVYQPVLEKAAVIQLMTAARIKRRNVPENRGPALRAPTTGESRNLTP